MTPLEAKLLLEACRKFADENDYCIVCNNHPSSGHSRTCPLRTVAEAEAGARGSA